MASYYSNIHCVGKNKLGITLRWCSVATLLKSVFSNYDTGLNRDSLTYSIIQKQNTKHIDSEMFYCLFSFFTTCLK